MSSLNEVLIMNIAMYVFQQILHIIQCILNSKKIKFNKIILFLNLKII